MKRSPLFVLAVCLAGCDGMVEGTRNALNKGGELAGNAAGEVIDGVTSGLEKARSIEVVLSDELRSAGLSLGRTQVEKDSTGTADRITIYLVAERGASDTLQAIAADAEGREMGRSSVVLSMAAGAAAYHTFRFQEGTDLAHTSRIEVR